MTYSAIALRIDTGSSNLGFNDVPVLALGQTPLEFRPKAPVIINETESWMITHAQDYTAYAIFSKAYKAQNGEEGNLLITLFVPSQLRIANGKSPLEILKAIMVCFMTNSLSNDALPMIPVNELPFAAVLNKYTLEERSIFLPVMAGKESAAYCVDSIMQLDALMRFSRYPALAQVGRLELGRNCASTIMIFPKGTPSASKTQAKTESPHTPPQSFNKPKQKKMGVPPKTEDLILSGGVDLSPQSAADVSSNYQSLSPEETDYKPQKKKRSFLAKLLIFFVSIIGSCIGFFVLLVIVGLMITPNDPDPIPDPDLQEQQIIGSCNNQDSSDNSVEVADSVEVVKMTMSKKEK